MRIYWTYCGVIVGVLWAYWAYSGGNLGILTDGILVPYCVKMVGILGNCEDIGHTFPTKCFQNVGKFWGHWLFSVSSVCLHSRHAVQML